MQKQEEKIKIYESSGNIYKDLGYKDAEEALAKAKIAMKINDIIKKSGNTQEKTAKILGIDQPKISNLINGRLRGFSMERLFKFLNALDHDVEIIIRDRNQIKSERNFSVINTCI